jgi:hypothetical protein
LFAETKRALSTQLKEVRIHSRGGGCVLFHWQSPLFQRKPSYKSSGGGCGAFAEIVVRCCDSIYRKYARRAAI